MCVAAIAWDAHPQWRIVAIGNRDEYHQRPAAPLARWKDPRGVIAGRDLQSGGTWLGVSEAGRFAVVTNLRGYGDPAPERASRGVLVTDLLAARGRYRDPRTAPLEDFNPFNLILADARQALFLSNRPDNVRTTLAPGIYGLSNGHLDEPWPKTLQIKSALLGWLNADDGDLHTLFEPLTDDRLPDIGVPATEPSDVKREAPDTPVFIRDRLYGTRCSTVVAIDRRGAGTIIERRFDAAGSQTGQAAITFGSPA